MHLRSNAVELLLSPSGYGIHWLLIDEDLAVGPLLFHAIRTRDCSRVFKYGAQKRD